MTIEMAQIGGLRETERGELELIVAKLIEAYQPVRIYLFGLWARGNAGPDSDYDLMVVVPDDAEPERCKSHLAYRALWRTGYRIHVLVWRQSYFDDRVRLKASLPSTILREGRLLYGS